MREFYSHNHPLSFIEFIASNRDKRKPRTEGDVGEKLEEIGRLWDLHKIKPEDLRESLEGDCK